jgi:hypothetical protein
MMDKTMEALTIKTIPKSYPGVFIRTSMKDIPFDYDEFMKAFHVEAAIKQPVKKTVVTLDTFMVKKIGLITIPEFTIVIRPTCTKVDPLVTNQSYTMENRMVFMNKIQPLLEEFVPRKDISCSSMQEELTLLPHQKLVQTYMNIDTPYRGVLLYHGLGSGKTCSSIAITENLKPYKNIVVMSPASLETNYVQELKKCGSPFYKTHQHWVWTTSPSLEQLQECCFTDKDLLRRGRVRGLWVHEKKDPNYDELTTEEQVSIQEQIDKMIRTQYQFIHYNGIQASTFKRLIANGNPFSNKVVVIDEAHNFVSRIVNQLNDPTHPSMQMYDLLMKAEQCKIILLTGTPVINYSHEVSILFNMLKGYITTYSCAIKVKESDVREALPDTDMVYATGDTMFFTQLPRGFIQKENEAVFTKDDLAPYQERLEEFLGKKVAVKQQTLLPDSEKEFNAQYIQGTNLVNQKKLMFRISGLCSYFPDLTQLMPTLREPILHVIPMSEVQLGEYSIVRSEERKREKVKKPKDDDIPGTYRIHSRLMCNTTYPREVRAKRPGKEEDENEELSTRDIEQFFKAIDASDYTGNIQAYSPKYAEMARVIQYTKGLHLVYSQFLTIEGIALFSKVLDSKGYTEFKLMKRDTWELNVTDVTKPMYVTYIGTKSQEEKELIRNVFNKNWDFVPERLRKQVENVNIQIFMITSAGAEGISLKEVQYVHIMEPYWNPVRIDQVIGRARRICSHKDLPVKEQFVEVHMYVMTFPETISEELKLDMVEGKPGSTDEFLFSISKRKRTLNTSIMDCIKKASVDCFLYDKDYLRIAEKDPTVYSYYPDATKDVTGDKDIGENIQKERAGFLKYKGEKAVKFYDSKKEGELKILFSLDERPIGFVNLGSGTFYDNDKKKTSLEKLKDL